MGFFVEEGINSLNSQNRQSAKLGLQVEEFKIVWEVRFGKEYKLFSPKL